MTSLRGAAATTIAWRTRSQLYMTVIAKATFAFAPDAAMTRAAPQEILRAEVHHGGNPAWSVRFTSDLVPYLRCADVLFTGDAHASPDRPVQYLPVRLAIFRGSDVLLDKRLLVQEQRGFQRMPIVYERAVSGVDGQDNPLGVGPIASRASILDPNQPARPAGFGPIARAWPARKRLLGTTPHAVLEGAIAEIPTSIDWSYFHAAPLDQRIGYLHGDEWIVLDGLHPTRPRLQTRLPRARGLARIEGLSPSIAGLHEPLVLQADTLRIDGEEQRCTVVWRRVVPIPDEPALAAARVVVSVALEGEAIAWIEAPRAWRAEGAYPPAVEPGPAGTVRIESARAAPPPRDLRAPESAARLLDEGARLAPSDAQEKISDTSLRARWQRQRLALAAATVDLTEEGEVYAAGQSALPFASPPPPEPPPPATSNAPSWAMLKATIELSTDDEAAVAIRPVVPFLIDAPVEPRKGPQSPIPGAPWSDAWGSTPILAGPIAALTTVTLDEAPPALPPFGEDLDKAPPAPSPFIEDLDKAPPAPSLFAETLDEAPPAPTPFIDDDELRIEQCAAIAAELVERPASRIEVLTGRGLSEARWVEAERRWRDAIEEETRRGERALRDTFDAAYVAAWEALRRPLDIADYARLTIAEERGRVAPALDDLALRRSVWARMKRLWRKRIARDRSLAARVELELARLRKTPEQATS